MRLLIYSKYNLRSLDSKAVIKILVCDNDIFFEKSSPSVSV